MYTSNENAQTAEIAICKPHQKVIYETCLITVSFAIDCFKCVSVNGNNPSCEDPFHNNHSSTLLHSPCWAGRKNRDGVFPATACVKLNGMFGISFIDD
ncbi:uncharacterized protein B4U80_10789 [Leptotrombidium deliense]|uniref:Uncharacterized protein n=1 Tax=Leptotrombidium deliense TaxID=299467 RepID=A0A443SG67_9ACAR|nr:uncharacterized protein B4U80_10789 [Leptotrombidium deliense]